MEYNTAFKKEVNLSIPKIQSSEKYKDQRKQFSMGPLNKEKKSWMDYMYSIMYILYIYFDHIGRENVSEQIHEIDQLREVKAYFFYFMPSYFYVGFSNHVIKYFLFSYPTEGF